jgi:hypothetical protein
MSSPAEREMRVALAQIGNETEPKEVLGIEGNKNEETSLAKNTGMTARVEDDVKMTDAPPVADDTKMNDDPPPATDEEKDGDPPPEPTKFTRGQREAITKVLQRSSNDYYGILGLKRSCTPDKIKSAYRKLSQLTHPDRNKFKDSTKAFQSE